LRVLNLLKRRIKIKKYCKNIIIAAAAFILLAAGAVIGYFITVSFWQDNSYIPALYIKGDVLKALKIDGSSFAGDLQDIENNGEKIRAAPLEEVLSAAEPAGSNYSIYIVANDGRTSRLSGDQLEKSYISFSVVNGWEAVNLNHPASTNIKEIKEIIVVLENRISDFGLNIIDMDKNITYITPGQALLSPEVFFENSGASFKNIENEKYETETFKLKNILKLDNFLKPEELHSVILMGSKGGQKFINSFEGSYYFEIDGNAINFVDPELNEKIEDLKGIVINPAAASIMDVYYDASGFIGGGKKVLFILTDGFGYHQYEYAIANGYAPFLSSQQKAGKALSVYQPVSNAGLAAMLTGKPPDVNGISSRKQREPLVPTIFKELLDSGKKAAIVEGDIQIIKTEIEATLNTDKNGNGTADDEILKAAMDLNDPDLAFIAVHFHSIDDAGHNYGDIDPRTMEQIKVIDSYIAQLALRWQGKIIITSDHGMHSTQDGGSHGEFRYEDLIVPYIITDGGL